jgi:hypothetical protein
MDFHLAFNCTDMGNIHDIVIVQNTSHLGIVIAFLTALTAAIYTIAGPLFPTFGSREPPAIPQKIHYIGHILVLAKSGITYYLELRLVFGSTLPSHKSGNLG